MNFVKKQRGHAAILFAMIIPVLFGVFMLGSDGARAVQDKARLNEALEVASLAVSAQASSNSVTRQNTAADYISYYFPLAEVETGDINVTVTTCNPGSGTAGCNSDSEERYFNYEVTGTITQDSWFPGNDVIAGFGETYDVASYSASRKYQSEAIDVMLVADFSASMYQYWDGGDNRKFEDVIEILKEVAGVLKDYNDNITEGYALSTIGVSGYDFYAKNSDDDFVAGILCSKSAYKQGNKFYWATFSDGRCTSEYPTHPGVNILDVASTISNVFNTSHAIHSSGWSNGEVTNISKFTNIELTSDTESFITDINSPSNFHIAKDEGSGTASFAGIIRGAQLLDEGNNDKRLLIVLSDGGDSYTDISDSDSYQSNNFSDQLYDAGLCDTISSHFENDDIDITMAVIGFDYEIDDFPQLANCVGTDNVYEAQNTEEIADTILSLITEEIGHLATQVD
ncbi:TadE/TadG family type IV pilus assembly protein [Vibrio sp. RC27]